MSITTFDGQGHLSVIGVSSPELAPEQLARKLATLFRGEEPVTDATPIAQDGWSGFRQEFERRILWGLLGKCRCIGFVASNGPILVFGQARDTVRRLAEWAGVVDRMIASINIKHS